MSHRPEGWEDTVKHILSGIGKVKGEPYPILIQDGLEWDITRRKLIEAGADAIVKALKKDGQFVHNTGASPYGIVLVRTLKQGEKGYLVFIPSEEEVKED